MFLSRALSRAARAIRGHPRVAIAASVVMLLAAAGQGWRLMRAASLDRVGLSPIGAGQERAGGMEPLARPVSVVTFADGCMTSRCHASMSEPAVVHAPVSASACQSCHEPDAGNHTFPVRGAKGEMCTSCHETAQHRTFQHRAMSEEGCLACHNPHGTGSPNLLAGATLEKTCMKCHPRAEGSSVHAPYAGGRCDACHDPHGAENASLLPEGEGDESCAACHAATVRAVRAGPHGGGGASGGLAVETRASGLLRKHSCMACHRPHAGEYKGLLSEQPRVLCTSCHADVGGEVSGASVSHDAVLKGEQCVTCHDPHGSGLEHTLRDTQPRICLSCHNKPVKAADGRQVPDMSGVLLNAPVVHGAVREGECSACHHVHGGTNARMLGQLDPGLLTGGRDEGSFTMCFACHDPNLGRADAITRFRDGDTNLHASHLKPGGKARGCASCHAVHSGDLPRLIARSVNFEGSGWMMPLEFELTPEGGACASSCHELLAYSRRPGGVRRVKNEGAP